MQSTQDTPRRSFWGWGRADFALTDITPGVVTQHHAVGRDRPPSYEAQTSPLLRATLAAAKHQLDPAGILNPGVLIDPENRKIGQRGALL